MQRPQKITFGEMRAAGIHGIVVYCADYHCSHHIAINGDEWPDDIHLSDIENSFVCSVAATAAPRCGQTSTGI